LEHLPKVDPSILPSLTNDCSTDFVIFHEEVERRLEKVNIHKAQGPDGLPGWFLRDFASYICQLSAAIFNASIREGCVPQICKAAEVIPVPKSSPDRGTLALTCDQSHCYHALPRSWNHLSEAMRLVASQS